MRQPDADPTLVHRVAERVFPGLSGDTIARAESGGSTQVYRIRRGTETFYLRIAETAAVGDLGPEALVHRTLREQGVKVPEVVHYDPFDEALGRSFMITTEIAGCPLAQAEEPTSVPVVLAEAGRDLAVVNSLPVAGFGWVTSDPDPVGLRAELPTQRAFALDRFDEYLAGLRGAFLTDEEVRAIRRTMARYDAWLDVDQAHLAHGDFDVTHIYQRDGRYTGIIDFGEIRGADRLYDLGHYALHDGETLPFPTLPHVIEGYREVAPLCAEDEARLQLWSLLIGMRALARSADRPATGYQEHLVMAIRRAVAAVGS